MVAGVTRHGQAIRPREAGDQSRAHPGSPGRSAPSHRARCGREGKRGRHVAPPLAIRDAVGLVVDHQDCPSHRVRPPGRDSNHGARILRRRDDVPNSSLPLGLRLGTSAACFTTSSREGPRRPAIRWCDPSTGGAVTRRDLQACGPSETRRASRPRAPPRVLHHTGTLDPSWSAAPFGEYPASDPKAEPRP